jgi:hypothetical protein
MGIYSDLSKKHGNNKNKVIQELLEIIKRMETEAILAQREAILAEKNAAALMESIVNKDWQIIELLKKLKDCLEGEKAHAVKLSIIFSNNTNPQTMSLELKSGQSSVGTLVVTDTVTGLPVVATFTNVVATSDSPSVASIVANPDGTITATGVSAGTANVSVSAIAAFTDSLGNPSSQSLSVIEVVTVDAVPVANPVSLSVNWSTPV